MKYLLIIVCVILAANESFAQHIVINEIMYSPAKPEPEWVELFNPTDSAISTIGWTVSDHLRTYPLLPDTIAALGYLVITKDSAHFLRSKYHIPNANILESMLPSLVNTGDDIVFRDSLKNIIDSLKYSPAFGGGSGISLERIDYAAPTDSENFGSSIDTLGATPGEPNSIRRRDIDLALERISYKTADQNDLTITVAIINKGRQVISDGLITLNSNSGLPISQYQITTPIQPLQELDADLIWQNADYGKTILAAAVTEPLDELHSDDTIREAVYLPIPRNAVVINEIMPTPLSSSSEWVELYNNSASIARLDSTMLHVRNADTTYKFRIDSLTLLPGRYAVIDASTKFFSQFPLLKGAEGMVVLGKSSFDLSDSGDQVMLLNTDTSVIDSLHYYSNWYSPDVTNHTNVSLERKQAAASGTDPKNWSSSLDPKGSTPLAKNSFASDTIPTPAFLDVQIAPNPFSPDGDGFDDATNITIAVPSDNEQVISAKLYDLRGRLRSTIALAQRVLRSGSIHFEGKDDNGITLPIGLYTLVVESANGSFAPQRKGIVIMKKAR